MNLKKLNKTWREACPDEAKGLFFKTKRKKPKQWKIMLDNFNRGKSICSICKNTFSTKTLSMMPDGGSGGVCKECKEKT